MDQPNIKINAWYQHLILINKFYWDLMLHLNPSQYEHPPLHIFSWHFITRYFEFTPTRAAHNSNPLLWYEFISFIHLCQLTDTKAQSNTIGEYYIPDWTKIYCSRIYFSNSFWWGYYCPETVETMPPQQWALLTLWRHSRLHHAFHFRTHEFSVTHLHGNPLLHVNPELICGNASYVTISCNISIQPRRSSQILDSPSDPFPRLTAYISITYLCQV